MTQLTWAVFWFLLFLGLYLDVRNASRFCLHRPNTLTLNVYFTLEYTKCTTECQFWHSSQRVRICFNITISSLNNRTRKASGSRPKPRLWKQEIREHNLPKPFISSQAGLFEDEGATLKEKKTRGKKRRKREVGQWTALHFMQVRSGTFLRPATKQDL